MIEGKFKRLTAFDEKQEKYKMIRTDGSKSWIQKLGDYESLIEDIIEVLQELENKEIDSDEACFFIAENIEQMVEE